MRLLYCEHCKRFVPLCDIKRGCYCELSEGNIKDGKIEVSGPCLVMAFSDKAFEEAIKVQKKSGDMAPHFETWLVREEQISRVEGR